MSNGADRIVTSARDGRVGGIISGGQRITRVLIDVDTQRDFMYPHGVGYFPRAGQIAPRVARLFNCARRQGYPVVSTTMCLRNSRTPTRGNGCREGSNGQKKPAFALLGRRASFGPCCDTDLPIGLLGKFQQLVFEKRGIDPFEHPKFDRLLSSLRGCEYVVFGLATEEAVKFTVLGLLTRGKQVRLVVDAMAGRDDRRSEMALRQMIAKGARVITTRELAPDIQPRRELQAGTDRFAALQPAAGRLAECPGLLDDEPGDNGNGKKAKARGGNGNGRKLKAARNGNGNGKKVKAHGGNGNGRTKSKPAVRTVAVHLHTQDN